jgi:hypothetical protein
MQVLFDIWNFVRFVWSSLASKLNEDIERVSRV